MDNVRVAAVCTRLRRGGGRRREGGARASGRHVQLRDGAVVSVPRRAPATHRGEPVSAVTCAFEQIADCSLRWRSVGYSLEHLLSADVVGRRVGRWKALCEC
eukprot:813440-Rhodomonas_salina.1